MFKSLLCRRASFGVSLAPRPKPLSVSLFSCAAKKAWPASSLLSKLRLAPSSRLLVRNLSGHSTGAAESDSKGVGVVPGAVPYQLDQGAGVEHEELLEFHQGRKRFSRDPLTGPFGTVAAPVEVPSDFESRFFACVGGGPDQPEHGVHYFLLHRGPLTACPNCGQVFKLVDSKPNALTEADHVHAPPLEPTVAPLTEQERQEATEYYLQAEAEGLAEEEAVRKGAKPRDILRGGPEGAEAAGPPPAAPQPPPPSPPAGH